MEKKVSVIMCTYNGAQYLNEQIESIIKQTYPIYEFIIQDDCSTDHTMEILKNYEVNYSYIRVFKNETQKGINKNFYSAIARATGEYIAIADQDDIWVLDKIEQQVLTIGNNWLSSGFSKPFAERNLLIHFDARIPNVFVERMIHIASATPGHTFLITRNLVDLIPDNCDFLQYDHLLSIVAAAYDKIFFLDKVLVHQRRHHNAETYTIPINTQRNLKEYYLFFVRTTTNYLELRSYIRSYFLKIHHLLVSLPENHSVKKNAQKMALLHSKKYLFSYIKLSILCVKCRKKIFHTEEKNKLISILRALFFPISCSDYFRGMSKFYNKF